MTNALSAGTANVTNFRTGSTALALVQAVAGCATQLQQLMVYVYNAMRLTTATGADVDSYVNDYGLTRNPAVPASTQSFTMTRSSSTGSLNVSIGGIVTSPTTGQNYTLVADNTQSAYNAALQSYVFAGGVTSINATIVAVTGGISGNALPGTITNIVSGFGGVLSVTNTTQLTNGQNIESDAALSARFTLYQSNRSLSTEGAIGATVLGVEPGLTYTLTEQQHFDGTSFPGGFLIVVDDGSGAIPAATLTSITNALNLNHAAGTSFQVSAPTNVTVNVSCVVSAAQGYALSSVETAVIAQLTTYINTLGVAADCTQLNLAAQIAATQISGVNCVAGYTGLLLNGVAADIITTATQLCRAGTITVT
jgi:uncharacterized phage protein gp47/JayE